VKVAPGFIKTVYAPFRTEGYGLPRIKKNIVPMAERSRIAYCEEAKLEKPPSGNQEQYLLYRQQVFLLSGKCVWIRPFDYAQGRQAHHI